MKNFSEHLQTQSQTIANPFLFTTPEVQHQIELGSSSKVSNLIIGSTIASIITAPLQTIVTSMQLSVLPHKQIFATVESRTKELAKLNTELTIAQKRKMELMIRSGGEFQPYVAPVYEGYQQAARNILKQGWQAFFKGLSFRLVHSIPHFLCYGAFFKELSGQNSKNYGLLKFIGTSLGMLYVTDWSLNMFQRYVFSHKVFRNVIRVLGKMLTRGEFLKGGNYHFLNGVVEMIFRFPVFLMLFSMDKLNEVMFMWYYFSQVLMYPVQTAYKRFICQVIVKFIQSTLIPGMIPVRYSSVGHALKVIAFEQKIKGLYRGFGLHTISVAARLAIIQTVFNNVDVVETGGV